MKKNSNSRIAKNTLYLYIRQLVVMCVALYTSRVVINTLGVSDYGIYNIVGGVVSLSSIVTSALGISTLRFISFELGIGSGGNVRKVFCMSMTIYIGLCLVVLFLAETIGLWFVNTQLDIPADRVLAAMWVYQFSILIFIVGLLKAPYDAMIIANEKMSFYAWTSIVEVILKLVILYILVVAFMDKLILYGILQFLVCIIIFALYRLFCLRKFGLTASYRLELDRQLWQKMLGFTGWTFFGSVGNVVMKQGGNILLNLFYGVTVNAAMGIANNVGAAVTSFANNFMMAFRPQLVKLYAEGEYGQLRELLFRFSLISYYLLLLIAIPFFINAEAVIKLWLGIVPDYTVSFSVMLIVISLIDQTQAPLWTLIEATGKIKKYQIIYGTLLFSSIPVSYLFLKLGFMPVCVIGVSIGIVFCAAILRILYVRYVIRFSIEGFFKNVILRILGVTLITSFLSFLVRSLFIDTIINIVITSACSVFISMATIYVIGINRNDREIIKKKMVLLRQKK